MPKNFVPNPGRKKIIKPAKTPSYLEMHLGEDAEDLIKPGDYVADDYCLDAKVNPFDKRFDHELGALLRRSASATAKTDWAQSAVDFLLKTDKEKYHFSEIPEEYGDIAVMVTSPVFIREAGKHGRIYYVGPQGYLRLHVVRDAPIRHEMQTGTEEVDPNYFMFPPWYDDFDHFVSRGDAVLLIGPSGCGKTETCERFFGNLGVPLQIVDCNPSMCADDLEGKIELVTNEQGGTETKFRLAAPALAVKEGHGLLLNEADTLQAEAAFSLYSLLNRKPLNILREAQIPMHNLFRVVGTQNTEGRGDTAGLFHGRALQDESFLDRWDQYILVDYPTVGEEAKILKITTGIPEAAAIKIAEVAVTLRNACREGVIMLSCGLRRTKMVARNIVAGFDYFKAWEYAFLNRATPDNRKSIEETLQRHYGGKKGKKNK